MRDRRGNALVIAGAALPLVIGSAGLAVDTVKWTITKRQLQRAADSGALAGVFGRQAGQTVSNGNCSSSTPLSRDLTLGDVTNRLNATPTCTVESPPTSGSWTNPTFSAVRVTVSTPAQLAFSSLFLSSVPTISATATAAMVQNGRYCMISLDNAAETGINFTGSAAVSLGCGMKTNAKGSAAVDCGGSSTITADPVAAVGYIPACSNFSPAPTYQSYSPPQADPYAGIDPPAVPNSCNQDLAYQGQTTTLGYNTVGGTVSATTPTTPQTLCVTDFNVGSGKTFIGQDLTVIINKKTSGGSSGNLNIQGNMTCYRCVFILTSESTASPPPIGTVDINAQGRTILTAPTSGTYNGIIIYQDRRAATCNNYCNSVNGGSGSILQGAIYMPKQDVKVNGGSGMTTDCLQIVAWRLQFAGNTTVSNSCPGGPGGFTGYMVRLVA